MKEPFVGPITPPPASAPNTGEDVDARFARLFRARCAELCTLAFRLLRDRAAAEDVVQDVFTAVWRRRHELLADPGTAAVASDGAVSPGAHPLDAYLRVAVRNRARHLLARDQVASRYTHEQAPQTSRAYDRTADDGFSAQTRSAAARVAHGAHNDAAVPPAVEAQLDHEALHAAVTQALGALPERQRTVFLLRRFGELSTAEVADLLGLSVKTVENHLGRALKRIASVLRPERED